METYLIFGAIAVFVVLIGYQFKKKKKETKRPVENGILVNITDPDRKAKVESAIQMILQTSWKDYVLNNISIVNEGDLSGVNTNTMPASMTLTYKYIDVSSMKWLASTFVHEARHVEQEHSLGGYKGQESELDSNRIQIQVLKYLGASQIEINYLARADGLHFDTNGNGILDPLDNWKY